MSTVNVKMTAIADEIRTLSGTTDPMGLDAMATNVGAANTEVGTQSSLLDQALAALEGKAAGGGGSVATCTFTTDDSYLHINRATIYSNGMVQAINYSDANPMIGTLDNVVCGTIVDVNNGTTSLSASRFTCTNCEFIYVTSGHIFVQINGDATSASITYIVTGGGSNEPI